MIPINYHHLYYFWTVAKCGSISAAKDRLYLSQPTLSSQLQELEEHCKAKLFQRSRKGVSLTARGRTVFDYCERIFTPGEELVALLNSGFEGPSVLRLGVETTISKDVILRMMDFGKQTNKHVRIAIFNGEPRVLDEGLRKQTLDFVVSNNDLAVQLGRDFQSRLVCALPVYLIANPKVKRMVRRFPSDLSHVPILLRPPDSPVRKQVDAYLSRHKISAMIEADVDDVDLIRRMAIDGRGAAAMNILSAHSALKSKLAIKLHKKPLGMEHIWFVCDRYSKPDTPVRTLAQAFMDRFSIRL